MNVGDGVKCFQTSRHAPRKVRRSGWNVWKKKNRKQINYTNGVHVQFDVTCTYRTHDCFYVYTCKPKGGGDYECSQEAHFLQYTGICCVPIC